ncbi:MAG TPA: hypothetical protein VNL14_04915 [Candidatus Acidoferrales bacterium]|nr:hypothetical protein [Candidatus Acidoferrales bacterium]
MKTFRSGKALFWVSGFFFVLLLGWHDKLPALSEKRPDSFLPEERRIITEYFTKQKARGLPPGLAKRGKLPPGLQKHLERHGTLPPGLQKRLEPFPDDLERRLPPLPEIWSRVILGRDVLLIDRRTQRILDIIENVIGLATER